MSISCALMWGLETIAAVSWESARASRRSSSSSTPGLMLMTVDLTREEAALQAQRLFFPNDFHARLEPDRLAVRDGGAGLQRQVLGSVIGRVRAKERDQIPKPLGELLEG